MRVIEINVIGVLNAVHPVLPRMIARGQGQIGIMSSLAGFIPLADAPSYCASKAAVLSYGLGLRGAVEGKGIRVSVVCPGYVDTPMIAQETGWQPFKMSAEAAAEQTVRGLAANRAVIAFPSVLATMSWIGGQLPDRVRRLTARPFAFKVRAATAAEHAGADVFKRELILFERSAAFRDQALTVELEIEREIPLVEMGLDHRRDCGVEALHVLGEVGVAVAGFGERERRQELHLEPGAVVDAQAVGGNDRGAGERARAGPRRRCWQSSRSGRPNAGACTRPRMNSST